MNFLFLNNYNYLRGGSEQVYFGEMKLLQSHGHIVNVFARKTRKDILSEYSDFFPDDMKTDSLSPGFGVLRTLREIIYSSESKKNLKSLLEKINPDVVHAHNIYGRLTTSVLDLLNERKIPVVMTLHDYKLICPSYKLMYRDKVCEDCKGGKYYKAIWNRCHKNSLAASAIYAFESWFNDFFNKYKNNIRFFIAPSSFLKDKLIEFGWSADQIVYIPNYIVSENFSAHYESEDYLLYIGRLSAEKGLSTLIKAFKMVREKNIKLMIVGDGPDRKALEDEAGKGNQIQFTGYLSGKKLNNVIQNTKAVVIPSEWYENAPISILEAFACGKPVIGAEIGGIPEMIDHKKNGLLFEPGNVDDLSQKIRMFLSYSSEEMIVMGKAAREKVKKRYNPKTHYEQLINVYENAISLKVQR